MTTVLITGIGGSIGVDVARSLRADPSIRIVGCDGSPWGRKLGGPMVDEVLPLPRADRDAAAFARALSDAIERTGAEFAFVNPDAELEALASISATLPCPTSMPPIETVGISLDKSATVSKADIEGVFPATFQLGRDGDLAAAFEALEAPLWIRSVIGAGGRGSLEVRSAGEADAWIRYWEARGKSYTWVLQEFLPGDNINWTGIYVAGECVVTAAMARLSYFLGGTAASGVSGQVSRCATVDPDAYAETSDRVVRALDATPHGVYSVDLRGDRAGKALVTEVNPRLAGRPWLYTNAGVNLALAAVRALRGEPIGDAVSAGGLALGMELHRQLDVEPVVGFPE